jgi:DNA-binding transcriptional regulator YiaG
MPTLAAVLRNEIRRQTAREVRRALRSLRRVQKQVRSLKRAARAGARDLARLERRLVRLKARRLLRGVRGRPGRRPSPQSIRGLRDKLGMTRLRFSRLLGVSPGSIFGWETGRTIPRGRNLARIAEVRKLGVRKARAQAAGAPVTRRRPRRGRGRRRR